MFTDRVKLKLVAGRGGHGIVAWRRETYIPKGGPAGGNGGRGGKIVIKVDSHHYDLDHFRNSRILRAENGASGGPNKRQGRSGQDLILKVPQGTLVKDVETDELLVDLTELGQELEICHGGKGGRGNATFATATNRAPAKFTSGTMGEEKGIELELKLIADVGLVGFPNAGKSTLIGRLAKVRVKIAPYPFTTLRPNLGYIEFDDFSRILIADIPGIIEGAHDNRGLGYEFLRHIERTKVLLFLLDASGIDGRTPLQDYHVLRKEVGAYDPAMLERPFLVALNKIDQESRVEHLEEFYKELPVEREKVFEVSAETGEGVQALIEATRTLAQKEGKRF